MGVNKNIRILMLFDCVWVNTGLVFNWICNREKKGVYVNWWWYQSWTIFLYYACWSFLIGENISIWMSSFRFESSCAHDGGMWWIILHRGGLYLVVLSSGSEEFFLPWVILRRERHDDHICIFEHSIVLWCKFRCGLCPYIRNGCVYGLIWFPPSLHVFLGCIKKPHPLLLTSVLSFLLFLADEIIRWSLTEKESTQCSSACGLTSQKSINHQSCDRYAMNSCQLITWWYHIRY
jgi:hypothetical protein